jgi:hypothetical protein
MSKKIVKTNQDEILNDFMASLSLKLDELNNNIITRISHIEDKIDLIVKRQTDIEDRISYRVEKNTANSSMSDTDSKDDIDARVIILKDKNENKTVTPIKKTKKKIISNENSVINKRGNITMRVYKDCVLLTGQTFDRKELIKQYGGKWDNKNMGWTVPVGKEDKLKIELERYTESLDYDELDEYLNDPTPIIKKSSNSSSASFNTCQIVDSDDD